MALTGQAVTHSPQPVQRAVMTAGNAAPPNRGEKRIAASPQASPQLRQTTLLKATHCGPMLADEALPSDGGEGLWATENFPRRNWRREITA